MKKTVIVQQLPHYPTPWGDIQNAWNVGGFYKGLGIWEARDYYQRLSCFSKNNFNITIGRNKTKESTLTLYHFFKQHLPNRERLSIDIDMQTAFDYLDEDPASRSVAFATVFDENTNVDNQYITNNSRWITRLLDSENRLAQNEETIEGHLKSEFVYLPDRSLVKSGSSKVLSIVWFFLYRTGELPIYYLVPNPDLTAISPYFDTEEDEEVRFWTTEAHFGSIGDIIFRPSMSKNIAYLGNSKIVAGDKFWLKPFGNSIFQWRYQEEVPKVNIKVISNLNWTRDPDSNKVYFEFKDGQEQGYIHIRWNENTVMGLSQTARSLGGLENKCVVTLDVYRNSSYKYTGD
jgi:hypothetical protein